MNERDDEIAKLIYGTQATYQEMQFAALIRADEREEIIEWIRNNYQDHNIASLCDAIRARENT